MFIFSLRGGKLSKTQQDKILVQLVSINYKAHTQVRPGIVWNWSIHDSVSRFSAVFFLQTQICISDPFRNPQSCLKRGPMEVNEVC